MLIKIIRVGYSLISKHSYFPIKILAFRINASSSGHSRNNNSNNCNSYNNNSLIRCFPNTYIRIRLISLVSTYTSYRTLYSRGILAV